MTSRYDVNDGSASTTSSPRSSTRVREQVEQLAGAAADGDLLGAAVEEVAESHAQIGREAVRIPLQAVQGPRHDLLDLRERRQRELVRCELDDLVEAEAPLDDLDRQAGLVRDDAGELRDEADGHVVTPVVGARP